MDSNKKISLKEIEDARLSIWVDADQSEKSLNRYVHPILNKFEKAAKELGVKATDVPVFKKVMEQRDRLEKRIVEQKKEYNNAAAIHSKGMRQTTEIDSAANKALDLYDAAGKSYLKANARYQEIEQASKELGVDVPSKIEALKKDISQSLKDIDNASKNLIKIKNTDLV